MKQFEAAPLEEQLRSVIDHVIDGIISIDAQGTITTFNPAAERIFGYTAAEVIGQDVSILMPQPFRQQHASYIANYLRTGEAKIIGIGREVLGRRKDGSTFPMELAISEFQLNGGRYFTGIVRDVTDRKRLEDELRRRIAELAEADRQKNEFLAMLGHELRNPLGPMRNALFLMKMAERDASALAEGQQMIERQLQHLVRLVDDLLDISRIIRGKIELRRERIDLAQVIRRAVETAQPVIDAHGHVLHISLPERPVWVMGDLIRLAQVIANLLTNAAKYTSKPDRIHLALREEGEEACMVVKDEGVGIPAELLPRIFDLFVQGDRTLARSQGGLGIGLTLVRRLVEMHGGRVDASSAAGKGAEFLVYLPLLEESIAESEAPDAPRGARGPEVSRKVLVVDDNVDAANSIAKILQLFGHEVRCVYDGPSALAEAQASPPDVIVLDIGLPGIDGYEVARRLRAGKQFERTPLIALTGYGQAEDRARSRNAGFDHHLTKPVDPEVLHGIVSVTETRQ